MATKSRTRVASKISNRPIMTAGEVAEYFGVSKPHILNLLHAGQLPGVKLGAVWRCHRSEIEAYRTRPRVEAQSNASSKEASAA